MKKPYSDRRWYDNPGFIPSLCGSCKYWRGFGKCDKYQEKVPQEFLDKSFPGTDKFEENYCLYRESK